MFRQEQRSLERATDTRLTGCLTLKLEGDKKSKVALVAWTPPPAVRRHTWSRAACHPADRVADTQIGGVRKVTSGTADMNSIIPSRAHRIGHGLLVIRLASRRGRSAPERQVHPIRARQSPKPEGSCRTRSAPPAASLCSRQSRRLMAATRKTWRLYRPVEFRVISDTRPSCSEGVVVLRVPNQCSVPVAAFYSTSTARRQG